MDKKIDYKAVRDDLVNWFKRKFEEGGGRYAIIGISGGKDSTVVAAIACAAIGRENVIGVMLPDHEQADIEDSIRVQRALGFQSMEINIGPLTKLIYQNVQLAINRGCELQENVMKMNTPPRIRMTQLRAIANAIPGGRLINTSNLSEFLMGYFTKDGDSCGDLFPLLGLTKSEIVEIGLTFDEIPEDLIRKAPADGLTGKTDEEVLGIGYDDIDTYIRLHSTWFSPAEAPKLEEGMMQKITNKHLAAMHKCGPKQIFFLDDNRKNFYGSITS